MANTVEGPDGGDGADGGESSEGGGKGEHGGDPGAGVPGKEASVVAGDGYVYPAKGSSYTYGGKTDSYIYYGGGDRPPQGPASEKRPDNVTVDVTVRN